MTRSRKKALLIGGLLAALPVLFLVGEHFRGKWALAKFRRELVTKGEKLTVDECRPPEVAPAENGYEEFIGAFAQVGSQSILDAAPPSLRAIAPGKVSLTGPLSEWPKSNLSRKGPATNSNWRQLEEALQANRKPLDEASAALKKPGFDGRPVYSLLHLDISRELVAVKKAGQCFNASAVLQLHQGRLDGALDDLEATLRLVQALGNGRMMIKQLIRYAVAGAAVGPTWQALHTPGWTDAQLARLQQDWQTNDFLGPAVSAMEMERAMAIEFIGRMRDSVAVAASLNNWSGSGGGGSSGTTSLEDLTENLGAKSGDILNRGLFIPIWQFAWSFEDERNYLASVQVALEAARAAVAQYSIQPAAAVATAVEQRLAKESFYDRLRHFTSSQFGDVFSSFLTRSATVQAQRDVAITAIALKRYELRHGVLPPDLGALVPEQLPVIPRDVCSGQPLQYRPGEGGAYLLYSVGKDAKDDGGNPKPPSSGGVPSYYNGRDLVWPQPATAKEVEEADERVRRKDEPPPWGPPGTRRALNPAGP